MRFTVATYNIHKGFSQLNRRMVIHELRERLAGLDADILFLQEVVGVHERHAARHRDWPSKPQHEFLADTIWHEVAYGRTAINRHGHHGNALLSRYPITAQENIDISAHPFESRGLLHCEIRVGANEPVVHCINVHLGLFERGRRWQIRTLCERIGETVPRDAPLVIAGDFNDWRHKANEMMVEALGVHEVFEVVRGRPARTFPSVLPVFRLDRIYARGLAIRDAHVHYTYRSGRRMSDHAALAARFDTSRRPR
jgi:endonuclease/exonuclease/phosphatase family metal-dependent hydrolase